MAQVEAKNPNEPEFIQAVRNLQRLLFHLSQKKNMTAKIYSRMSELTFKCFSAMQVPEAL
jgi:ribosomal protein L19E